MSQIKYFFYWNFFLLMMTSYVLSQNEKFYGGSYDGSAVNLMPSALGLNGGSLILTKYGGGEQDGSSRNGIG